MGSFYCSLVSNVFVLLSDLYFSWILNESLVFSGIYQFRFFSGDPFCVGAGILRVRISFLVYDSFLLNCTPLPVASGFEWRNLFVRMYSGGSYEHESDLFEGVSERVAGSCVSRGERFVGSVTIE